MTMCISEALNMPVETIYMQSNVQCPGEAHSEKSASSITSNYESVSIPAVTYATDSPLIILTATELLRPNRTSVSMLASKLQVVKSRGDGAVAIQNQRQKRLLEPNLLRQEARLCSVCATLLQRYRDPRIMGEGRRQRRRSNSGPDTTMHARRVATGNGWSLWLTTASQVVFIASARWML